jgi:hypothetical protein
MDARAELELMYRTVHKAYRELLVAQTGATGAEKAEEEYQAERTWHKDRRRFSELLDTIQREGA